MKAGGPVVMMEPKPPVTPPVDEVDVMGVEFSVGWEPGLGFGALGEEGELLQASGHVDYEKQSIRIARDGSEYTKRVVLLHEVIHAVLHTTGQPEDEDLIRALGYGLMYVLRHNPKLRSYLLEDVT